MVVEELIPTAATSASHPSGISQDKIDNIMSGISNTGTVKLNNHRKKLRQRFDIIKKLGQGTYGKVQLGINKETGQEVAIKTIKKCKIEAEADLIRIRREVQIMSSVQHPNIIHIYEVFENREKMVLVMEFAAGGELYDYLSDRKVLTEDEARRVFRQVSTAVYYCHKHKICHRDLKLENILLDEHGNAKIADFGLSNVFDDRRLLATFCGSPLYASPEIVKGTPYQGPEVDCWSLGVLLYTLVYGSMPFDGSNFSRLVKQISQGDYYEPKKTSRASPLIRDMLTANPEKRADIEQICQHWWVNEGYKESCLELAEALANQTPVRLDVLLSLSPMSVTADQLVIPSGDSTKFNERVTRSHSVGSIRCVANSEAERRILDMVAAGGEEALMPSPTRNLTPISPNQIKRKIEVSGSNTETAKKREKAMEDRDVVAMESAEADLEYNFDKKKSSSNLMDVVCPEKSKNIIVDDSIYSHSMLKLESVNESEVPSPETSPTKVIKKFVSKHKTADLISSINKISPEKREEIVHQSQTRPRKHSLSGETHQLNADRGRLGLETSEKFQRRNSNGKLKVNILSGVNVSNFRKEFERRSSIPSTNTDKNSAEIKEENVDKPSVTNSNYKIKCSPKSLEENTSDNSFSLAEARRSMENSIALLNEARNESAKSVDILCAKTENIAVSENIRARERKLQNAREIIGNAIQPGVRKLSVSKHTYVIPENSTSLTFVHQPLKQQSLSSSFKKPVFDDNKDNNIKTSKAEITLKSATLPRRKTSKAEIKLEIQLPISEKPMRFSTEMKHRLPDIRSAPIEENYKSIPTLLHHRATSLGPTIDENREHLITSQKPPMYTKQHFNSRRSTSNYPNKNDTLNNINNPQLTNLGSTQPIKKSPREFIIPIAVEGGGFITPRSGSIESLELNQKFSNTTLGRKSKLVSPFLNEVEPEENSSFHRSQASSVNKDNDLEPRFSLHRLRSTRPIKKNSQDSQSSGEEEDDDGFEILTAENLFSTLLQRVRALTNRLNVNNDLTTGFPNSTRLLSNMRAPPFWNQGSFERRLNGTIGGPWRHSLSRDIGSDIESMFSRTATLPRGKEIPKKIKNKTSGLFARTTTSPIDLADLDLSRLHLSKKDFETLSNITSSLPTSFQQQLIAKLPPNHSRKLSRTLSMQNNMEEIHPNLSQINRRKNDNIADCMKAKYTHIKKLSQNRNIQSLANDTVAEGLINKTSQTEYINQPNNSLACSNNSNLKNISNYQNGNGSENLPIVKKQSNNVKSFEKLQSGYSSKQSSAKREVSSKSNLAGHLLLKSNSVPKEVYNQRNHKKSLKIFNNSDELQEIIQQPSKTILNTYEINEHKLAITNIILNELENLSSISQKDNLKHDNKSKLSKKIQKQNLNTVHNINLTTKCRIEHGKPEIKKQNMQEKKSKLMRPKSYPYKDIKTFTNLTNSSNSEFINFNNTNNHCRTSLERKYLNIMLEGGDDTKLENEKNKFNKLLEMAMQDAINNIVVLQKNDEIKTERTKSLNNISINIEANTGKVSKLNNEQSEDNTSGKKSRKGLFLALGKKIELLRRSSKTDEPSSTIQLSNRKLKQQDIGNVNSFVKQTNRTSSEETVNEILEEKAKQTQNEIVPNTNKAQISSNDSLITESGLLKKAISAVEINKCSVKKLLGLFKRIEKDTRETKILGTSSTNNIENKITKKKNNLSAGKLLSKVIKSTSLEEKITDNIKNSEICSLNSLKKAFSRPLDETNCNIDNKQIVPNTDNNIEVITTTSNDLKKKNFHTSRKFYIGNNSDINENHLKYNNSTSRPLSWYQPYNVNESLTDAVDLQFDDPLNCSEINKIASNASSPTNLLTHLDFSTNIGNDQNDTMMDRIKRRSFYCRFNDNKPKRQSNIVGLAAREYYRETEAKHRSRPQGKPSLYATNVRRIDSINNGSSNNLDTSERGYTTNVNAQRQISLHFMKSNHNSPNEKQSLSHISGRNTVNSPEWNYSHYNTIRNRGVLLNEAGTKFDSKSNVDSLGNIIPQLRQYETRCLPSVSCVQNSSRLPIHSSSKHNLRSHSRDTTRYLLPFSAIPKNPSNA